jgi:hypothetical protein
VVGFRKNPKRTGQKAVADVDGVGQTVAFPDGRLPTSPFVAILNIVVDQGEAVHQLDGRREGEGGSHASADGSTGQQAEQWADPFARSALIQPDSESHPIVKMVHASRRGGDQGTVCSTVGPWNRKKSSSSLAVAIISDPEG